MVFTNYGKQAIAWAIGSDLNTATFDNFIGYVNIGSGSGTVLNTNVTLVEERDRNPITGSPNFDTVRKVQFQGDFNSVEMSGIDLTEFGLIGSGTGITGSVWQREAFGSIVFDGTNELQILSTIEII